MKTIDEDEFREAVMDSVRGEDSVLIANYNRATLGQTGTGHFSPIAAYDPHSDRVLILDVARFKYPPHWVKVSLLFQAVAYPRGYLLLSLKKGIRPLMMFKLSHLFLDGTDRFWDSIRKWVTWLSSPVNDDSTNQELFLQAGKMLQESFQINSCCGAKSDCRNIVQDKLCEENDCSQQCRELLCTEISRMAPFKLLADTTVSTIPSTVALATVLLSWPYDTSPEGSVARSLRQFVSSMIENLSDETRNEIRMLRTQIGALTDEMN